MFDFEFELQDRIAKIQSVDTEYDLLNNAYISFSGGKDSTILHYLIDIALPNNKMPRVFINTGIEYFDIVNFVKELAETDDRILIINSGVNIQAMLQKNGYPFKSKEHSLYLSVFQNSGLTKTVIDYLGNGTKTTFLCPACLRYQFSNDFNIKISDKCCKKLKKEPIKKWEKQNNKSIALTGMRRTEGGHRISIGCTVFKDGALKNFHPLAPLTDEFCNQFIKNFNIKLCKLYYPPYNFKRTGCKGCPFALDLDKQLDIMEKYLPAERKQCEFIWKPVYDEYRRINYRLKKHKQLKMF